MEEPFFREAVTLVEEYSQNKPWSGGDSEKKASVLHFLLSKHLLSLCIS